MRHERIAEYLAAHPWLIEETWLRFMLSVASGELEIKGVEDLAPQAAIQVREGERYADDSAVLVRDDVAIVPINGPMTKRASFLQRVSGMTDYERTALEVSRVAADAGIRAILLDMDTPGGSAHGVEELAAIVREARDVKPVIAHTGGVAASAGYWVASAADEVVITQTAWLGSIGARMVVRDFTKLEEKAGVKTYDIVSSRAPMKTGWAETEEGRARILDLLNEMESVFIASVAENRGVSEEKVVNDFGRGGILVGRHAVEAGLADRIGSFESALALAAERGRAANRRVTPAAGGSITTDIDHKEVEMSKQTDSATAEATKPDAGGEETARVEVRHPDITLAYLEERHPTLLAEIRESAASAAAEEARAEERERITEIQAMALPGQEKLAARLVAEGVTMEQASMQLLADLRERRQAVAGALKRDEEAAIDGDLAPSASAEGTTGEADPEAKAASFILNAGKARTT